MDSVRDNGEKLVRSGHSFKSDIQKALTQLEEARTGLTEAWKKRKTTLEQARDLQVQVKCLIILQ